MENDCFLVENWRSRVQILQTCTTFKVGRYRVKASAGVHCRGRPFAPTWNPELLYEIYNVSLNEAKLFVRNVLCIYKVLQNGWMGVFEMRITHWFLTYKNFCCEK